jgi:D-alanine-D-alanine ligase
MGKVILLYNDYVEIYSRTETSAGELNEVFSAVKAIKEALENLDNDVISISVTKLNLELLDILKKNKRLPVFNLCESLEGDPEQEKVLPIFMEENGITYTGSGPFALTNCLNKFAIKKLFSKNNIPTPGASLIKTAIKNGHFKNLRFPLILKPVHEDASIGISASSVVHDDKEALERAQYIINDLKQPALAEEFIEGREISASVWGNMPPSLVELSEIDFSELPPELPKIVTYNSKWNADSPEYIGTKPVCPAPVSAELRSKLETIAVRAFQVTGCRDYGRVDMRISRDGEPFVIDVNPNPDLSPDAGFFRAVRTKGYDYTGMVGRILEFAKARTVVVRASSRAGSSNENRISLAH